MQAPEAAQPVTAREVAGPRDPATTTPARRPGSIRRTSTVDMLRPDGRTGDLFLICRARDLVTTDHGAHVAATAAVDARADATRALRELRTTPEVDGIDTLLGTPVASGFRGLVEAVAPQHRDACTPLYLLLDDLPVAALVSGYAMQRAGEIGRMPVEAYSYNTDQCAGWRADGTLMVALSEKGAVPMTIGPTAPDLRPADDHLAWHEHDPLPPGGMRRRRRLDVHVGDPLHIDAMFRDSYMGLDGVESIVPRVLDHGLGRPRDTARDRRQLSAPRPPLHGVSRRRGQHRPTRRNAGRGAPPPSPPGAHRHLDLHTPQRPAAQPHRHRRPRRRRRPRPNGNSLRPLSVEPRVNTGHTERGASLMRDTISRRASQHRHRHTAPIGIAMLLGSALIVSSCAGSGNDKSAALGDSGAPSANTRDDTGGETAKSAT